MLRSRWLHAGLARRSTSHALNGVSQTSTACGSTISIESIGCRKRTLRTGSAALASAAANLAASRDTSSGVTRLLLVADVAQAAVDTRAIASGIRDRLLMAG